jgi:HlyD family secretion protein
MIRILLVDDQNIMRQGLQALLEPRPKLKIVGTAQDGCSAIEQVKNLQPDIVLMDIEMPGMSGIIATEKIYRHFPSTKVIILSSHEDREYLIQGSRAGAKGYLLKNAQAEDVEQVIWSVYQGHSQIESRLLGESLAEVSLLRLNASVELGLSTSVDEQLQERSLELDSGDQYLKNGSSPKINKTTLKPAFERSKSESDRPPAWNSKASEINIAQVSQKPLLGRDSTEKEQKPQPQKSIFPKLSRWWIMGLVVIPVLLIATIILVYSRASKSSSQPVVEAQVTPKAVGAIGYLEPQGEVIKVSAPALAEGARVEQLLVKRGDKVKTGQIVAILDNRDRLQAAFKQAQTEVKTAQARLAQVKAGAKQGEIQAKNAKFQETKAELAGQIATQTASIANLEAQLKGQTNSQQATIARLKAEFNNATKECQRYEFLLADGAIAASERDTICLQQATTQKQLQAAEVNLIEIKATLQQQIGEAQANLKRTKATLANQISEAEASFNAVAEVRPVDVAVAQTELETAEATVTKAQVELDLASVKSPMNGQILEINTWPGEIVDNAKGIVAMGNTQNMYVVAEVYETDIDRVRIGQSAIITSDSITKKFTGTVDEVGWQIGTKDVLGTDPVADTDARVVKVKIRLNAADSKRVTHLTNLEVNTIIDTSIQSQK